MFLTVTQVPNLHALKYLITFWEILIEYTFQDDGKIRSIGGVGGGGGSVDGEQI